MYSPAGRLLEVGSIKLGHPPDHLLVGQGWEVAIIGGDKVLQLWDVLHRRLVVKVPLPPSTDIDGATFLPLLSPLLSVAFLVCRGGDALESLQVSV